MDTILNYITYIKNKLLGIVSISENTDVEGTISRINKGVSMKGANVWILIASAMLASIGLDVNSSAVIIGAMLISPLMSPILGIGLGVGISDRDLMLRSLYNFTLAVVVSIISSTLYFIFTPLGEPTAEMMARTTPTLLDVGVAVFGGVAGIVANSRREMSNAIPGVAIATALMPPLCTAGYGIATWNPNYFFGAFYLFFINAVFIALSTYLIVRFLQFPYITFIDRRNKKKIQRWIAIFAFIVIVPSGIIFYNVVTEARTKRSIRFYISNVINSERYEALEWNITKNDSTRILKVFVIGEPIPEDNMIKIEEKLEEYRLGEFDLRIVQMNVPESERDRLREEVAGEVSKNLLRQVTVADEVRKETNVQFDSLNSIIGTLRIDDNLSQAITKEIEVIFPEIESIDFGTISKLDTNNQIVSIPVAILDLSSRYKKSELEQAQSRFEEYFKIRSSKDSVLILKK